MSTNFNDVLSLTRNNINPLAVSLLSKPQHSLFTALWLISLVIFAYILYIRRHHALHNIPGPLLARWCPLWLAYHARVGQRYQAVHKAHQLYGPYVRISPNHISISHPDAASVVYRHGTGALNKSSFYHAFVTHQTSVFSTTSRTDHAQKRRMVSQAFSYQSLQQFLPFIHEVLCQFVSKVDAMCDGDFVDALLLFNYLAFDILSDLAFGEAIGMVRNGSDAVEVQLPDCSKAQEHAISLVDDREHFAAVVGLHWSFKFLSRFIPDPFFVRGRSSSNGLEVLARARVVKRLQSGQRRNDILGNLISARQNGADATSLDSHQIDELTAEAVTLLIAGSDTTSNSITAILHFILTHPSVYYKLLHEIDEVIGDAGNFITHDHVKKLPYLDATINEGLRLHAITAIGLPRTVPEDGLCFEGKYFPAGTELSVPAWTIQHDPEIWNDPETFRPERWIGSNSKDMQKHLLSFGKGPRACLGRNLAYIEMGLTLATLLSRYEFTLQSQTMPTTEGFMHKPLYLMVKFTRRKQLSH